MQRVILVTTSALALMAGNIGSAQDALTNYSLFGTPGLLEMPTAQSAPEGTLAGSLAYQDGLFRATATFQLTPRLSASARYSVVDLYEDLTTDIDEGAFERSFDLQYRLNNEGTYLPAFAIGIRDAFTPGRFASEYIVASKSIGDNLIVTGGIGWGAMGLRDGFDNPFSELGERPVFDDAESEGQLGSDFWFRGDAAAFGGLSYQINEKWGLVAEYSSIDYPVAAGRPALEADSPYNFGVTYRPRPGTQLSLASLYGSEIALSGTFTLNANNRPAMSGLEKAPAPVNGRSAAQLREESWDRDAVPPAGLRAATAALLEIEGLTLRGLEVTDDTARIRYSNNRYRSHAQAMGRVARMMTQVMPASVETFILETEARGIPLSSVTIRRSDLEQLENRPGATAQMLERVAIEDAAARGPIADRIPIEERFRWGLGPYLTINPFSSDGSIAVDAGLSLSASYTITPRTVLRGAITQSVLPADKDDPSPDTDDIPNVRTDGGAYGDDGVPVLQRLTLASYGRPATDIYSRITVGYLERMYGGVSTELLWKPVDSRLGLGAELNYAVQRDSDMAFGFDEFDYDVVTGHVSAYYDLGNGYHTQLDVGRYLAGDWGATLSIDREYENGVRVGAYVTQTEISYDDFGDGSYNKGVQISIPQDFITGQPNRGSYGTTIRTRVGDGGARLNVGGRLYGFVRDAHQGDLTDTWGRFWR
ncbi:YjbH domain-containing protein [Cognatiyoonia sp. IB215446]|uniref:YjbH domain-containing protein n=1 Tax=Cognatiyoonia sp. IB215446 TaxID=3097355 RepID=UPI002A17F8FA|nr:YjbH domain-containing protein [Cognatiyoonia sp. IB215446]MDX8350383.1 YjbH domain-containing protein [Cognatiyoonia sp. IB215446]